MNFVTLKSSNCHVRHEAPYLQTEDRTMSCLVRLQFTSGDADTYISTEKWGNEIRMG